VRQLPLLTDHTQWFLRGRMVHVVPRADATGYVLRVRWSPKLGLQLDHVFPSHSLALRHADRIELTGRIRPVFWKRIYHPKWSPTCLTLRSGN
jgi:hypothetical protein